jgi:hypothetical protein
MSAYLSNRPELTPTPVPSSFSISTSKSPSRISTPEIDQFSDGNMSTDNLPIPRIPSGFHLQEVFSLADDDPYLALSVRTSSLESFGFNPYPSSNIFPGYEEEAEDVEDSTVDSLGPCTPPRLSCRLIPSDKRHMASNVVFPGPSHLSEESELASFIDFTESFFEDVDTAIINEK